MRHTLPIAPQFYVTAPQPCPYLEGRMERKLFTALQGDQAQRHPRGADRLRDEPWVKALARDQRQRPRRVERGGQEARGRGHGAG